MLFEFPFAVPTDERVVPALQTPHGAFRLQARFGGEPLPALPQAVYAQPSGEARLLHWRTSALTAEALVCRPELSLPEGMRVDGCLAVLWRVRAMEPVESCAFDCTWQERQNWLSVGAENGQGLEAFTWSDGRVTVSAGTEDGESLLARASRGRGLPLRWADPAVLGCSEPDCIDRVHAYEDGLHLVLPDLRPGETCQVHFAVAWAPAAQNGGESAWFAVGCSPRQILDGAHAG
jgi:hypothetical protein